MRECRMMTVANHMVDHSVYNITVYGLDKSIRSGEGMTGKYATLKRKLQMIVINPDTARVFNGYI